MLNLDPINIEGNKKKTFEQRAKDLARKQAMGSIEQYKPDDISASNSPVNKASSKQPSEEVNSSSGSVFDMFKDSNPDKPSNSSFEFNELMAGATPALVGLLVGQPGAGFQRSSDAFGSIYQNKIDQEKARLKALQAKSSSGGSLKPIKTRDGRLIWANPSDAEGQEVGYAGADVENYAARLGKRNKFDVARQKAMGQNFDLRELDNGVLARIDKKTGEQFPVSYVGGLTPNQKKSVKPIITQYSKDVTKTMDNYEDLQRKFSLLQTNNLLGKKTAIRGIITDIESRLTDADARYYQMEVSLLQELKKIVEEQTTDEVNPRIVRDAVGIISKSFAKMQNKINNTNELYRKRLKSSDIGIDDKQMDDLFSIKPNMQKNIPMALSKPSEEDRSKRVVVGDPVMVEWDEVQDYLDKGYSILKER